MKGIIILTIALLACCFLYTVDARPSKHTSGGTPRNLVEKKIMMAAERISSSEAAMRKNAAVMKASEMINNGEAANVPQQTMLTAAVQAERILGRESFRY